MAPEKRSADQVAEDDINQAIPNVEYSKVISDRRALEYVEGKIPKPIDELTSAMEQTRDGRLKIKVGKSILFWYKSDLRIYDNRGLSQAYELARDSNVPLICVYTLCPEELRDHVYSPPRINFNLRSLQIMHQDLRKLNIPLVVEKVDRKEDTTSRLLELAEKYGAKHVFANIEYEVDELRREAKFIHSALDNQVAVNLAHDTCLVNPNELVTKTSNKPFSVFSPYYKAWVAHLCQHMYLLDETTILAQLGESEVSKPLLATEQLTLPELPADLQVEDATKWAEMWPAGEHVAQEQLNSWINGKLSEYRDRRDMLAEGTTSRLSVYLSSGNLAARTAVRRAIGFEHSGGKIGQLRGIMNMNANGVANWTSEVAWRDFYKSILVSHPYVCMNKPFKLKTASVQWSDNKQHYRKWIAGQTGFPVVDASMRQLLQTGYMHNRARMIVASFLTKHLLINWQWGEYFFMRHLIDGDFASNNGGWGFSSSCGVDAQPYFRIFNPYRQSERFDPEGKFIREWVPELEDVPDEAIHDPHGRGYASIAKQNGYPEPMVSHAQARQLALDTFKANNAA